MNPIPLNQLEDGILGLVYRDEGPHPALVSDGGRIPIQICLALNYEASTDNVGRVERMLCRLAHIAEIRLLGKNGQPLQPLLADIGKLATVAPSPQRIKPHKRQPSAALLSKYLMSLELPLLIRGHALNFISLLVEAKGSIGGGGTRR